jgi:hypothetical protein
VANGLGLGMGRNSSKEDRSFSLRNKLVLGRLLMYYFSMEFEQAKVLAQAAGFRVKETSERTAAQKVLLEVTCSEGHVGICQRAATT